MILFFISFVLIFASSYLITSLITPKKSILGVIYLFLIAFAQIILTFEILSLFTAIKEFWVLALNILFFVSSAFVWNKNSRPMWSLDCRDFIRRVINSFKLDKSLIWLFIGFCVLIISAVTLCVIMPITNLDALAYHVARSLFWVLQGSLNHFDTTDIRNLCLPINSEILYSWVILFVKKDVFLGFFSFIGYMLSIISIYNILGLLGYCMRKKLWVIFILSSFSSVIVQLSSTETDIIITGLILSSIFLFWYAVKNEKIIPVFMSALAYAIAIGTKTTAIVVIPSIGLFMIGLCLYFKKYKPFLWFLAFGFLNFLVFSSYNYILNFIQFGNFIGSQSLRVIHQNYYGFKGLIANFIKYIFMFFDFTGFRWSDYFGTGLADLRNSILNGLNLTNVQDGIYTVRYLANRSLLEPLMGAGILGFMVYLPVLIWASIKSIFKWKSKKCLFIFMFALLFWINLLTLSYLLVYMSFSIRFIMCFMVLSSPILVYSYLSKRNPIKYIIILFALFYLTCVSTHLWSRPFFKALHIMKVSSSITDFRERATCKDFEDKPMYRNAECVLRLYLENKYSNKNKILIFPKDAANIYLIGTLIFEGYSIDFRKLEDADKIDFGKYNLVITMTNGQTSTVINDYAKRKNEAEIVDGKFVLLDDKIEVPCLYIKNPNLRDVNSEESSMPYRVQCYMKDNYLKQKHLESLDLVGLVSANSNDYNFYNIYRNMNLPLYRQGE